MRNKALRHLPFVTKHTVCRPFPCKNAVQDITFLTQCPDLLQTRGGTNFEVKFIRRFHATPQTQQAGQEKPYSRA